MKVNKDLNKIMRHSYAPKVRQELDAGAIVGACIMLAALIIAIVGLIR